MSFARLAVLAAAFTFSGFAALVYQVGWQRILALHSGVGTYSVAMIVAAFMAGLGIGSFSGGLLSARLSPRGALRAFVAAEVVIGGFGLASPWLYYEQYPTAAWLVGNPLTAGVLHFVALLIPTCAMGMSLPLLARGVVEIPERADLTLGVLYGLNVLGASLGAAATPWWFLPQVGIEGALRWAALANFAAALFAFAAGLRLKEAPPAPTGSELAGLGPAEQSLPGTRRSFGLWMALYAGSGFVALALEVLWFRVMDVAVKANTYTFGTLLSLYLLGYGAGSLGASRIVRAARDPLAWFCSLQVAMLLTAATPFVLLQFDLWPDAAWYNEYWRNDAFALGQATDRKALTMLYVQLPLLLFGVPTLLMGAAFPLLQRAVQVDRENAGRRVGLLQSANIAGCVAGSLAVGLIALEHFGASGTLRLLILSGLAFGAVGAILTPHRARFIAASVLLAAAALSGPNQTELWTRLHGTSAADSFIGEDKSGVVALVRNGRRYFVYINGRGHSWLPFGGIHTRLGAMPAIVHPAPIDVAIIGLGSGDSAWGVAARPETRAVDVWEIAGPLEGLLRRLAEKEKRSPLDPGQPDRFDSLRSFLNDPRVTIRTADGRTALRLGDRRYDIIEADALGPDMAYSGNLYSYEFFVAMKERLKPGGLVCTWAPTVRVSRTFRRAFEHVLSLPGQVLIGSNRPIPLDPVSWAARAESAAVTNYLSAGIVRLALRDLQAGEILPPAAHRARRGLNHDLFPRDEYGVPQ